MIKIGESIPKDQHKHDGNQCCQQKIIRVFFSHDCYYEGMNEKLQAICEKVNNPLPANANGNFFGLVANFNGIL